MKKSTNNSMNTNIKILATKVEMVDNNKQSARSIYSIDHNVYMTEQYILNNSDLYDLAVFDKETIDEIIFELTYKGNEKKLNMDEIIELASKFHNIISVLRKIQLKAILN